MPEEKNKEPKLVRRRANRKSTLKTGRTLSAKRERLETSSERTAIWQKARKRQKLRLFLTIIIFLIAISAIIYLVIFIMKGRETGNDTPDNNPAPAVVYKPTIEIIDEDSPTSQITSRMSEYIGQAEVDFREQGLIPIKAVIPTGAIREVDFYLDGKPGRIKMIIDRDTAVSVEDAVRMLRYLENQGITTYEYIDVRLPGKAYWK